MKLGGWLVMLTVMCLTLSFIGLNIPGLNTINQELGSTLNETTGEVISSDLQSSGIWTALFSTEAFSAGGVSFSNGGILIAIGAVGLVIVGFFARGYDPSLVLVPFLVLVAGLFISTFVSIISYINSFGVSWMTAIVTIIFTGLGVGFIMAILDYFGNR